MSENNQEVVIEEIIEYVDENGNPVEVDENGNIIEESILEEDLSKKDKYSFEDLASNDNEKNIFRIKDDIDKLLNNGKDLKKKFFEEAELVETEEAERLMDEAFRQIEEIRTKKTGVLAFSEKYLPSPVNNFIQSSAIKIKEEERKRQDIVEITTNLFSALETKQNEVESSTIKFSKIKEQMLKTVSELEEKARYLENERNKEGTTELEAQNIERLITIVSSNILMFKENIQNINAAQNISHQCVLHIDQMLPTIENSMTDSLAISAFLSKINNFKDSFSTVASVTNQIQQSNSDRIHTMIKETGDFEELLTESVKGIENRAKERKALGLEMKKQEEKNAIKHIQLRNTIADSLEDMVSEEQASVFKSDDDVAEAYIPSKIDIGNRLTDESNASNVKKTVRQVKKVVKKKVED